MSNECSKPNVIHYMTDKEGKAVCASTTWPSVWHMHFTGSFPSQGHIHNLLKEGVLKENVSRFKSLHRIRDMLPDHSLPQPPAQSDHFIPYHEWLNTIHCHTRPRCATERVYTVGRRPDGSSEVSKKHPGEVGTILFLLSHNPPCLSGVTSWVWGMWTSLGDTTKGSDSGVTNFPAHGRWLAKKHCCKEWVWKAMRG